MKYSEKYTPEIVGRFEEKVMKPSSGEGACWLWTGAVSSKGYGSFSVGYPATELAHRAAFEIAHRRLIRSDQAIRKTCTERLCVNPDHLKAIKKSNVKPNLTFDADAIMADYKVGLTWKQIMQKHGISNGGLARIIKQKLA